MKTNYLFTLLTALLFLSCGSQKEDTNAKGISNYKSSERPSQALSYNELVPMLKYYDTMKRDTLRKTTLKGGNDTRVNFYRLEDLKAYIAYVEKLAVEKKIKVTGINIISAAYPKEKKYGLKQGYQTLVFMPTTMVDKKENVSFDPIYSEIGKPRLFTEILYSKFNYSFRGYKSNTARTFMKSTAINATIDGDEMESSAANRTHISPPY